MDADSGKHRRRGEGTWARDQVPREVGSRVPRNTASGAATVILRKRLFTVCVAKIAMGRCEVRAGDIWRNDSG